MASSSTNPVAIHVVVASAFTIWVVVDSLKRNKLAWGYAIFSFLWMWFICLPFYFAGRPLKAGETREGGYGWNVCKYFLLLWTFLLGYCLLFGMASVSESLEGKEMGAAESAGAAIGVGLGLGMFFCLYVGVAIPVIITGLLLKKNSVIETGSAQAGGAPPLKMPAFSQPAAPAGTAIATISVARQGQNIGSFDLGSFKQNIASGVILPTDHYWSKGMAGWELVSNFRG